MAPKLDSFGDYAAGNPGATIAQYTEKLAEHRAALAEFIGVSVAELHVMGPERARIEVEETEADAN